MMKKIVMLSSFGFVKNQMKANDYVIEKLMKIQSSIKYNYQRPSMCLTDFFWREKSRTLVEAYK